MDGLFWLAVSEFLSRMCQTLFPRWMVSQNNLFWKLISTLSSTLFLSLDQKLQSHSYLILFAGWKHRESRWSKLRLHKCLFLYTWIWGIDPRKSLSTIGKNSFNFMHIFFDIVVVLWILLKLSSSFLFFLLKIFLVPTIRVFPTGADRPPAENVLIAPPTLT